MDLRSFRTPALISALRELVRIAVALEVAKPDQAEWRTVGVTLAPKVRRILEGGRDVFSRFLEIFDEGAEGEADGVEALFRAKVADQCFVARLELSHWIESFREIDEVEDPWMLIARCNQGLGTFIKAATALEEVVCRHDGTDPELGALSDTELCINLRRAYTRFRQAIGQDGEPLTGDLARRVQEAVDAIARLLGGALLTAIRISDRCQLMNMHERAHNWLLAGQLADPKEGQHIWQDMLALSELMMQVNRRQELVEHDRELVGELLVRLSATEPEALPAVTWHSELSRLFGRAPDLDAIIDEPATTDTGTLFAILSRIGEELVERPDDERDSTGSNALL